MCTHLSLISRRIIVLKTAIIRCEISPAHLRGKATLLVQLSITCGIAAGFFICYGSTLIDSSLAWRLPFALQTITSLVVAVGCHSPRLVHSPRWLMLKGRHVEAEAVADLMSDNTAEKADLLRIIEGGAKHGRFTDIFAKGVRGRTCLGAFL